jgi:5-methylcytosine-specific restriction protein A
MAENPFCVHCEQQGVRRLVYEWDHIKPLWLGGVDDKTNLQGLCELHHKQKTKEERGGGR